MHRTNGPAAPQECGMQCGTESVDTTWEGSGKMGRRRSGSHGFTLAELALVIAALAMLSLMIVVIMKSGPSVPHLSRQVSCVNNLEDIGQAMQAYSLRIECYPYMGSGGGALSKSASASLALWYPDYLGTPGVYFKCPSTRDAPAIVSNKDAKTFAGKPNWSSYGYDPETSFRLCGASDAIVADMDGSSSGLKTAGTANHAGGQNVLYFDGQVEWSETVYANKANPLDNIYRDDSSGKISADMDAYVRR
jgi:prepilin-type processing-associated H-X9-DG protein